MEVSWKSRTAADQAQPKVPERSFIPRSAKLLLSILLLWFVMRLTNPAALWTALRSIDIPLMSVTILMYFPAQALAAYRWNFLLKQLGRPISFWALLGHNVRGQVSTLILPGQISGDLVRAAGAARGQNGKVTIALSVVIDKVAFLIAVIGCALLGWVEHGPLSQFRSMYVILGSAAMLALVLLSLLCRYRPSRSVQWLTYLQQRWPGLLRYSSILEEVCTVPRIKVGTMGQVLAFALALQAFQVMGSYVLLRAMHISVDIGDWAAINAFVALAQVLPLSIGGLGIREGLFAGTLALFGIAVSKATAFSLVGFTLNVLLILMMWLLLGVVPAGLKRVAERSAL